MSSNILTSSIYFQDQNMEMFLSIMPEKNNKKKTN